MKPYEKFQQPVVKFLDDELNIIKDLKKQAKAANIRAVMPYFADLARQWNADLPPSADFEYTEDDAEMVSAAIQDDEKVS